MRGIRKFFAGIIAVFAIALVLYLINGDFTGNVIQSETSYSGEGFMVHGLQASEEAGNIFVSYYIDDRIEGSKNFNVSYELYDGDGNVYASGSQNVISSGIGDQKYGFSFNGDGGGSLMVTAQHGDERSFSSIPFSRSFLTGNAINESSGNGLRMTVSIIVFAMLMIGLFLFAKRKHTKKQMIRASEKHNNGFIELDLR